MARALAQAVGARLIMGVNFEADSRVVAGAEARAMLEVIGRRRIQALELGNEPELYGSRPWYSTPTGREVSGRPADWWFPTLNQDYAHVRAGIGSVPLAGPTIGSVSWMADLSQFLAGERHDINRSRRARRGRPRRCRYSFRGRLCLDGRLSRCRRLRRFLRQRCAAHHRHQQN